MEPSLQPETEHLSNHHSDVSNTSTAVNSPNPAHPPQSPCAPRSNASTRSMTPSDNSSDAPDDGDDGSIDKMDPVQGWPQLALLMSKTPDFAAFPRFRDLNVKSLLYYQCQLTQLRVKLHRLEYEDERQGKEWATYADELVASEESEQFKTIEEIRIVLEKYNKALLQYSKICALPDPEAFNMRTLRQWLRSEKGANFKVDGRYGLENTWGDVKKNPNAEVGGLWRQFFRLSWGLIWARTPSSGDLDLAVTAPQRKIDGFTRWVAAELIPFGRALAMQYWSKEKKKSHDVELNAGPTFSSHPRVKKEEDTLVSWSESGPLRVTSGISTLVACLLPVVAITVLSQLHGLKQLLSCLAGFAVVFALGLIFLTQGTSSRTEIFAATAAFSAVMVVFISVPPPANISISVPHGSPIPSVIATASR